MRTLLKWITIVVCWLCCMWYDVNCGILNNTTFISLRAKKPRLEEEAVEPNNVTVLSDVAEEFLLAAKIWNSLNGGVFTLGELLAMLYFIVLLIHINDNHHDHENNLDNNNNNKQGSVLCTIIGSSRRSGPGWTNSTLISWYMRCEVLSYLNK